MKKKIILQNGGYSSSRSYLLTDSNILKIEEIENFDFL